MQYLFPSKCTFRGGCSLLAKFVTWWVYVSCVKIWEQYWWWDIIAFQIQYFNDWRMTPLFSFTHITCSTECKVECRGSSIHIWGWPGGLPRVGRWPSPKYEPSFQCIHPENIIFWDWDPDWRAQYRRSFESGFRTEYGSITLGVSACSSREDLLSGLSCFFCVKSLMQQWGTPEIMVLKVVELLSQKDIVERRLPQREAWCPALSMDQVMLWFSTSGTSNCWSVLLKWPIVLNTTWEGKIQLALRRFGTALTTSECHAMYFQLLWELTQSHRLSAINVSSSWVIPFFYAFCLVTGVIALQTGLLAGI